MIKYIYLAKNRGFRLFLIYGKRLPVPGENMTTNEKK